MQNRWCEQRPELPGRISNAACTLLAGEVDYLSLDHESPPKTRMASMIPGAARTYKAQVRQSLLQPSALSRCQNSSDSGCMTSQHQNRSAANRQDGQRGQTDGDLIKRGTSTPSFPAGSSSFSRLLLFINQWLRKVGIQRFAISLSNPFPPCKIHRDLSKRNPAECSARLLNADKLRVAVVFLRYLC